MTILHLLLFASPQLLLYLYLRERLPLATRPWLVGLFTIFNIPWLIVAVRMFSGSLWGISRIPYIAPFIAWQFLGWIFCGLVTVYLVAKGVVWVVRRSSYVVREPQVEQSDARLTSRQFLVRATYAYGAAGIGLSAYGIWSAERLPVVTRRTLFFPDLPLPLNGLRIAHLSDVHAGVPMPEEKMRELVLSRWGPGQALVAVDGRGRPFGHQHRPVIVGHGELHERVVEVGTEHSRDHAPGHLHRLQAVVCP